MIKFQQENLVNQRKANTDNTISRFNCNSLPLHSKPHYDPEFLEFQKWKKENDPEYIKFKREKARKAIEEIAFKKAEEDRLKNENTRLMKLAKDVDKEVKNVNEIPNIENILHNNYLSKHKCIFQE